MSEIKNLSEPWDGRHTGNEIETFLKKLFEENATNIGDIGAALADIEEQIPEEASADNKLADKAYVDNQVVKAKDIFIADYGSTSYQAVVDAYADGKMVFCCYNDSILTFSLEKGNLMIFSAIDGEGEVLYSVAVNNEDDWEVFHDGEPIILQCSVGDELSPTSTYPVQNKVITAALNTINGKIPSAASSTNKLADKEYVNGLIVDGSTVFNEHTKAPSGYAVAATFAQKSELVTSISSSSDDAHYPSAKAVYDFIMSGSATITISTQYNGSSITNIFANTEYQITVKATTSIKANSIVLKRGSTIIKTATNVTTTSKTETVQLSGGSAVSFSAVANINGIEKSTSKTIKAYDKVFWGMGTENDYSTVSTDSKVRTSIAGTYDFTFAEETPYVYILVPTTMNDLNKAEMGAGGMGGYNLTKITDNGTLEANPGVNYRVWRGVAAITDNIQLIIS